MKIVRLILKFISLTPLIGLIALYYIWSLETYYVITTEHKMGFSVSYNDPSKYSIHNFVNTCIIISTILFIPALISTVIGIILTIRIEKKFLTKKLLFYLVPLALISICLLNFWHSNNFDFENPFAAWTWFID
jgi:hypothetical protein